jgi:hypothetical protein
MSPTCVDTYPASVAYGAQVVGDDHALSRQLARILGLPRELCPGIEEVAAELLDLASRCRPVDDDVIRALDDDGADCQLS